MGGMMGNGNPLSQFAGQLANAGQQMMDQGMAMMQGMAGGMGGMPMGGMGR